MAKVRHIFSNGEIAEFENLEDYVYFRKEMNQTTTQTIGLPKETTPLSLTDEEIEEKLPRNGEIEKYILSKPNFRFSMAELTQKFLGMRMKVKDNEALYNRLYKRMNVAKNKIAKEHNGKWKRICRGSRVSKVVEYVFKQSQILNQ